MNKKKNLSVVDGTKDALKAPRPHHGIILALYETIDALGGASIPQVFKYLPAALPPGAPEVSLDQVEKGLYNGVYRGYFIHNATTDHYYIAPVDYYSQRRVYIAQIEAKSKREGKTKSRKPKQNIVRVRKVSLNRPLWHWAIMAGVGVAGFALGFIAGLVTGVTIQP